MESSFDFEKSRNELAAEIKKASSREEKVRLLDEAKQTPEYQISKRMNEFKKVINEDSVNVESKETPAGFVDIRSLIPEELKLEIDYQRTTSQVYYSPELRQKVQDTPLSKLEEIKEFEGWQRDFSKYKNLINKLTLGRFHDGQALSTSINNANPRASELGTDLLDAKIDKNVWISIGDNTFMEGKGLLNPIVFIGIENETFKKSCLVKFWNSLVKTHKDAQSYDDFVKDYELNGASSLLKYCPTWDEWDGSKEINKIIQKLEERETKYKRILEMRDGKWNEEGPFGRSIKYHDGNFTSSFSELDLKEIPGILERLKNAPDGIIFDNIEGDTLRGQRRLIHSLYALLSGKKMFQEQVYGGRLGVIFGIRLWLDDSLESLLSVSEYDAGSGEIKSRIPEWRDVAEAIIDVAGGTAWYANSEFEEKVKKENNLK